MKEQKELITQLETDLLSVNALPTAFRGQGEVRDVYKTQFCLLSYVILFKISPYYSNTLSSTQVVRVEKCMITRLKPGPACSKNGYLLPSG